MSLPRPRAPGTERARRLGVARSAIVPGELVGVLLRDQLGHRHVDELGVGDLGRPGEEPPAHRLRHAMQGLRRSRAIRLEVEALEDVEHLGQEDPAGRERAHAVDVEAAVGRVDRGPLLGLVRREVVEGDQATVLGHVARDDLRGAPGIELVGPLAGDPVERVGQVGLDRGGRRPSRASDRASRTRRPTRGNRRGGRAPVPGRPCPDFELALLEELLVERRGERRRDREPLTSQPGGRANQVGPGVLPTRA